MEEFMNRNLFATVLTYAAPSSNYRGESEENRTVMQKITKGGKEHPIISPESMRNALREMLQTSAPYNRTRLHNEGQLAVEFKEFPDPEKYADDFFFGYLVTEKKVVEQNKDKPVKRDSVFRMNMAVSLTPYRFNAVFHQSPQSKLSEAKNSGLFHREVAHTAYQYPFALSQNDCKAKPEWTKALLSAIGQLNSVAGGHARSYYEMSPASIVVRLTPSLVAGYDTYGFDDNGNFAELVGERSRINENDLPGGEFWLGGEIVRKMDTEKRKELEAAGVKLYDNPQKLLVDLAEEFMK
jgi:CRISPR-associated protein Cst2